MCENCDMTNPVWGDMSERFNFEAESMDYYDGPLSGWLWCKECNLRFAFNCSSIIAERLWHWSLLPASDEGVQTAADIFGETINRKKVRWLSIVEDRRLSHTSHCTGAWLEVRIPRQESSQ